MLKCCIFDLDGTLLDTLDTIRFYVNKTLSAHEIPTITREECSAFVGNGARKLIGRALESRGVTDEGVRDALLAEYMGYYNEAPRYLTRVYDGIPDLLKALREKGIKLAVLSNKQDDAAKSSVRCFFGDTFDAVFGGREGALLKPEAGAANPVLEALGVEPRECAFVGDSEVDVTFAKNFGATVGIAVLWGFRTREQLALAGATDFAERAEDVLNILELIP